MKITNILKSKEFIGASLIIGFILLLPLVAMQFSNEVVWTLSDFIVAGFLLYSTAFIFIFASKKLPGRKFAIGVILLIALVYIWAELAVGIFTNWGS